MCAKEVSLGHHLPKIKKILVIYWGCFGDLLEAEPFFRALRQKFFSAEIHAVIGDWYDYGFHTSRVFKHNRLFDRVVDYSTSILQEVVVNGPYELVIDMCNNTNSKLLRRFSGVSVNISGGFRGIPRSFRFSAGDFNIRVPVPKMSRVKQIFLIAKSLGIKKSLCFPRLAVTVAEYRRAETWLKKNLKGKGPLVVIHPFGKKYKGFPSLRLWPEGCYQKLVKLLKEKACRVVFAGSPEELEDVRRLRKRLNLGAVACFKDIRDYLGLISCADLFVSGDGGPLHMALAVGIRSVGIFYSRDTAYYWYDVPNRPGFTPVFLNRQSAQEKQVDKVWKTVVKILNK